MNDLRLLGLHRPSPGELAGLHARRYQSGPPRFYASTAAMAADSRLLVGHYAGHSLLIRRAKTFNNYTLINYLPPLGPHPGEVIEDLRHLGIGARATMEEAAGWGISSRPLGPQYDEPLYDASLLGATAGPEYHRLRYQAGRAHRLGMRAEWHQANLMLGIEMLEIKQAVEQWRARRPGRTLWPLLALSGAMAVGVPESWVMILRGPAGLLEGWSLCEQVGPGAVVLVAGTSHECSHYDGATAIAVAEARYWPGHTLNGGAAAGSPSLLAEKIRLRPHGWNKMVAIDPYHPLDRDEWMSVGEEVMA